MLTHYKRNALPVSIEEFQKFSNILINNKLVIEEPAKFVKEGLFQEPVLMEGEHNVLFIEKNGSEHEFIKNYYYEHLLRNS